MANDQTPTATFGLRALLWLQGLYYLVTGIWPLVSIESFQLVTGRKTDHLVTGRESDHWLVMTVALLITTIALSLLCAAWRRQAPPEIGLLAVSAACVLTAVDVAYVNREVLPRIYLADALAEVVLLFGWMFAWFRRDRPPQTVPRANSA